MKKNRYGIPLDSNGYAPSIIAPTDRCFFCESRGDLVRHEVYHGYNRKKSKELGLWVTLCPTCHQRVHYKDFGDTFKDAYLKIYSEQIAMRHYKWSQAEFIEIIGKNYL